MLHAQHRRTYIAALTTIQSSGRHQKASLSLQCALKLIYLAAVLVRLAAIPLPPALRFRPGCQPLPQVLNRCVIICRQALLPVVRAHQLQQRRQASSCTGQGENAAVQMPEQCHAVLSQQEAAARKRCKAGLEVGEVRLAQCTRQGHAGNLRRTECSEGSLGLGCCEKR